MKKVAIILIIVAISVSLCSCGLFTLLLQNAMPGAADGGAPGVDYWQSIPSSIPRFNYGTYDARMASKMSGSDHVSYMMVYEGVTKQDIDQYAQALDAAGFDVTKTERYDSYGLMATPKSLDMMSVPTVMVNVDLNLSDGSCMVSVDIESSQIPNDTSAPAV